MAAPAVDDVNANLIFAAELVAKIDHVIALAEACADHAPENNAIINAGRTALVEVAAFFEVDVPNMTHQGEGRAAI